MNRTGTIHVSAYFNTQLALFSLHCVAFKSLRKLSLLILLAETAKVKIPLFRVKKSLIGARL